MPELSVTLIILINCYWKMCSTMVN
uniref:Uncharacterized protein n=1 Tax=Anguilla anguilla TaxID=7936 RepID=A0A0E9PQP3_ANGAN